MKVFKHIPFLILCITLVVLTILLQSCQATLPSDIKQQYSSLPEKVDFNFHIRPLLADRCYKCHGPDANTQEAGLRLDLEENAFAKSASGYRAIVKGKLNKSEAWKRITSDDPELQMPPPSSNLSLSANEKALIAKWIEQGAEWKAHWAFIPPVKPKIDAIDKTPIDYFISRKLKEKGLHAAPKADKERLIRRLSFDLRGLPASLDEIDYFLKDDTPQAYENLVDRFLHTDAHAERMAMEWLDVARFADSHGLHADGIREMWPWRDWVIEAFKKNLSYRDFVTWQLAGDLIPDATREQKLATAFHRNHTTNSEFGIVSEEYRLKYVADRANTTATAFMGLTMECASCHDHKFDPISQKEYYEMTGFFNNVKELGMIGNDKNFGPLLLLPKPAIEKRIKAINKEIEQLSSQLKLAEKEVRAIDQFVNTIQSNPIKTPKPDGSYAFDTVTEHNIEKGKTEQRLDHNKNALLRGTPELVEGKIGKAIRLDNEYELVLLKNIGNFDLDESFSASTWIKTEKEKGFQTIMGNIGGKNSGWRGWIFYLDSLQRPAMKIVHSHSHNFLHVVANSSVPVNQWHQVTFCYDGSAKSEGIQLYLNGQALKTTTHHNNLYKNIKPVKNRNYKPDPNRSITMGKSHNYLFTDTDDAVFKGSFDQLRLFKQHLSDLEAAALFQKDVQQEQATRQDKEAYLQHYLLRHDQNSQQLHQERALLRTQKFQMLDSVREVMVMQEMAEPRKTYIRDRGQYDAPTIEVANNTPRAILPFDEALPKNRLGLAQWLFDERHPLTARVAVNRYWQMIFGKGIVETPHDFGTQGALPSHPDLLDWLAIEFRQSGWDVRALLKQMVCTETYKQSSAVTKEQLAKDPQNIYLSRGASYRLPAEMIRDNSLAASGLLQKAIGGPSVKPYQPEGLWKDKNEFSGYLNNYIPDTGAGLYRRSMYTFIRRTSPPPSMIAFDATDRSVCTVKRENTSTPLQSLVLLNDPQYVEAARVLAQRLPQEVGNQIDQQMQLAFRLICGRKANANEINLLKQQYDQAFTKYKKDPKSATALIAVGEAPFDESLNKIETAAMAMVTNMIMNFDEAYMKR